MTAPVFDNKPVQGDGTFKNFSKETTIHGFRYIGEDTSWLRKLLWLMLLVVCTAVLVVQVLKKWEQFRLKPIATNIVMQYPAKMNFPAVVICNSNQYRISQTQDDLYYYITNHYLNIDASIDVKTAEEIRSYETKYSNFSNIDDVAYQIHHGDIANMDKSIHKNVVDAALKMNSREYLEKVAHQIDDMLLWCVWPSGKACNASDFKMIRTDYGICYTINSDIHDTVHVDTAGVQSSLYIGLNIEEYERMAGPQKTIGLKVFIYNQTSLPMVGKMGIDVPPGYHTQLAVNYRMTQRLHETVGGTCINDLDLIYFDDADEYTVDRCRVDSHIENVRQLCNCLMYYTPNVSDCTIKQHFDCAERAPADAAEAAQCLENCTSVAFRPMLSLAQLPGDVVERSLSAGEAANIKLSYHKALEARSRLDATENGVIEELIRDLFNMDTILWDDNWVPIRSKYWDTFRRLQEEVPCFDALFVKYADLVQQLQNNAKRFEHEMHKALADENILYRLFSDTYTVKDLANKTGSADIIKSHSDALEETSTDVQAALALLISVTSALNGEGLKGELMGGTMPEYTALFDSIIEFENGSLTRLQLAQRLPRFRNLYQEYTMKVLNPVNFNVREKLIKNVKSFTLPEEFEKLINVTSEPDSLYFLTEAIFGDARNVKRDANCSQQLNDEREQIYTQYDMAAPAVTAAPAYNEMLWNQFGATKYPQPESLTDAYGYPNFHPGITDMYGYTVYPKEVEEYYVKQGYEMITQAPWTSGDMETWAPPPDYGSSGMLPTDDPGLPPAVDYNGFDTSPPPRVKREMMTESDSGSGMWVGTETEMDMNQQPQQSAQQQPKTNPNDDYNLDLFDQLCPVVTSYDLKEMVSDFQQCITGNFTRFIIELEQQVLDLNTRLQEPIQQMINNLKDYNAISAINSDFYLKNSLAINIYYQDLSKESLIQEKAYDIWSLACDVGGTLGLFLGASIMTVFEVIDFFILKPVLGITRKKRAKVADDAGDPYPGAADAGNEVPPLATI